VDRARALDDVTDDALNLGQLVHGQRLVPVEIEAQLVLIHQGTLLLNVPAEHTPESEVQDVRHGVVRCDIRAALVVHLARHRLPHLQRPLHHRPDVQHIPGERLYITHLHLHLTVAYDQAPSVCHLPACLSVEGGVG
jgi:hypothetical protein